MNLLASALTLQDVNALQIYHLHRLAGQRREQYALDIGGRRNGYRLLIQPINAALGANDEPVLFYKSIRIIRIEEVSKHYA